MVQQRNNTVCPLPNITSFIQQIINLTRQGFTTNTKYSTLPGKLILLVQDEVGLKGKRLVVQIQNYSALSRCNCTCYDDLTFHQQTRYACCSHILCTQISPGVLSQGALSRQRGQQQFPPHSLPMNWILDFSYLIC